MVGFNFIFISIGVSKVILLVLLYLGFKVIGFVIRVFIFNVSLVDLFLSFKKFVSKVSV